MKTSLVQIVALTLALVFAAAAQDFLPSCAGVKPPLLVTVVLFSALRLALPAALSVGVAAGLLGDTLTGLTPCCFTAFLPLLALASFYARAGAKDAPLPLVGAISVGAAAVCGEIWLILAGTASDFSLLVRLCAALLIGLVAGALLFALLSTIVHHIGLDAEEEAA